MMRKIDYIKNKFPDAVIIHTEYTATGDFITFESKNSIITLFFNDSEHKIFKLRGGKYAEFVAEQY